MVDGYSFSVVAGRLLIFVAGSLVAMRFLSDGRPSNVLTCLLLAGTDDHFIHRKLFARVCTGARKRLRRNSVQPACLHSEARVIAKHQGQSWQPCVEQQVRGEERKLGAETYELPNL